EQLPFELTEVRIRKLCAQHTGIGSDGILLLSEPDDSGPIARLRIFNPDGSESGLSGNGARQAILYLRHHGKADSDTFSLQTGAGEIRATISSDTVCTIDMGHARVQSEDFPNGPDDGRGALDAGGA